MLDGKSKLLKNTLSHEIIDFLISKTRISEATASSFISKINDNVLLPSIHIVILK